MEKIYVVFFVCLFFFFFKYVYWVFKTCKSIQSDLVTMYAISRISDITFKNIKQGSIFKVSDPS